LKDPGKSALGYNPHVIRNEGGRNGVMMADMDSMPLSLLITLSISSGTQHAGHA
jgi:hypothetical protein